jgi:hypothetical protein
MRRQRTYHQEVITRLRLKSFKGFQDFTIRFGAKSVLVGPNSAGKSTVIAAVRSAAAMLRHARARKPVGYRMDGANSWNAYDLDSDRFELETENLRFEFHSESETRLDLSFSAGARLTAVWPGERYEDNDQSDWVEFALLLFVPHKAWRSDSTKRAS